MEFEYGRLSEKRNEEISVLFAKNQQCEIYIRRTSVQIKCVCKRDGVLTILFVKAPSLFYVLMACGHSYSREKSL